MWVEINKLIDQNRIPTPARRQQIIMLFNPATRSSFWASDVRKILPCSLALLRSCSTWKHEKVIPRWRVSRDTTSVSSSLKSNMDTEKHGKRRGLSAEERTALVVMYAWKLNPGETRMSKGGGRELADTFGVTERTVRNIWCKAYSQLQNGLTVSMENEEKSGRPSNLTPFMKRQIYKLNKGDKPMTVRGLQQRLDDVGVNVARSTVHNWLNKLGQTTSRIKPTLSLDQKKQKVRVILDRFDKEMFMVENLSNWVHVDQTWFYLMQDSVKKRKATPEADVGNSSKRRGSKRVEKSKATATQLQKKPKAPFYLFKSEPSTYPIDTLENEPNSTTEWDGVRNYQARNLMQEMKIGDRGFYYHSNCKVPGIVGIVEVVKEAYADHTAWDAAGNQYDPKSPEDNPRWYMVDIKLVRRTKRMITLPELKVFKGKELSGLVLVNNSRLSVQPVSETEWEFILSLEDEDDTKSAES